jgi:hypothetical protein
MDVLLILNQLSGKFSGSLVLVPDEDKLNLRPCKLTH